MPSTSKRHQLGRYAALFPLLLLSALPAGAAEPLRVLAAGSLKNPFTAIIARWQSLHPEQKISMENGPAGWLRGRIEKGERFDIYASAALSHAEALSRQGLVGPAVLFARNTLCATVKADAPINSANLVDFLLKPSTRIATSTPKLDPGGDYAWEFFRRLEISRPGAYQALSQRAQQLYGGPPDPQKPPPLVAALIGEGKIDVALGYCSGAKQNSNPALKGVPLPAPAPTADYGLALARSANGPAADFALFILSPTGQQILADYGFNSIGLPSE